ncbi:MAG: PEP-utilizing enzyme, partial [Chloroflexota bacterium]|nr:PEP-utilizing enzyme [Chloroflexota bacterium]
PILGRAAVNVHDPEAARARLQSYIESQLVQPQISGGDRFARLRERLQFMYAHMSTPLYRLFPRFVPMLGPAIVALRLLTHLASDEDDAATDHGFSPTALEITRSLPHNVTTEMDLALWKTARTIREDEDSYATFTGSDATELAARYLSGSLPEAVQAAITDFMHRYGMRGVGEIDLGQPRWREEPTSIMQTIQSYIQIPEEHAPDVLFQRGAEAAARAIERLVDQARQSTGGEIKARLVRAAARRARVLLGLRESPKFFIIRLMGILRENLLASGEEFMQAGVIEKPEDLFFLHFDELQALADREHRDWRALVAERRNIYERENRRRQVPRVLVSDGRTFYEGIGMLNDTDSVISGSPVSPGVVEGVVHIILDPRGAQLVPGEILVCPGTDPAWTPLFMAASGLITEVGGMMTHGSVVAREYGIPAVVGVHEATTRLKDGQRIRVDGTAGKIIVLD